MSNLSELLPAGAGAKSADFVASGTLGSGVTVALQSDGTVEAVGAIAQSAGSPVVFYNGSSIRISLAFDSTNNKVVIAYRNAIDKGVVVVGTVSGTSISFGSEVIFDNGFADYISTVFDSSNNKIVISYLDGNNSDYGTSIIGTVSGTSISFGTPVVFQSAAAYWNSSTFDSNSNKVVVAYRGTSQYGRAIVGTVSGTSISFGTPEVFEAADTQYVSATFDSNENKVVIAYRDGANSNYGTAIVGTVSGTSISFGTAAVFESANTLYIATSFDPSAGKIIVVYRDGGNADSGTAIVGTVSGTSISFGTAVSWTGDSSYYSATYDASAGKIVISYRDDLNVGKYGTVVSATVSGTSISFDTPLVFEAASVTYTSAVFDSNANKVAIAYRDVGNSNYGTSVVFTTGSTNNTDFIGITDQAIADTATGAVIVQGGVSDKLSGLTVGADYYVQADGSIASPTVSLPYNIVGSTYVQNFSVSAQETAANGITFNNDGTQMYIAGLSGQDINEYLLSSAFDVSTASFVQNFSISSQDTQPNGVAFNSTGSKMFVSGDANNSVYEYNLSSNFNISTAVYSQSFSVATQDISPANLTFNNDGSKMFVVGYNNDNVYEYALSSSYDISTASFTQSKSILAEGTYSVGLKFNPDGTKMYTAGYLQDVNEYTLSSAFDISTASFSVGFDPSAQGVIIRDLAFNTDGTKMILLSDAVVNEYSTGTGSVTTVPAGRALSSTSILLEG